MTHLCFSADSPEDQLTALSAIVHADPVLMQALTLLRDADLPDWLLVSGALYNTVWNALTGRAALSGICDIDVFYFDATDLSYQAEDTVIQRITALCADLPLPVQVRNQARVHLWFEEKFGLPFTALHSSAEMLTRFAAKTHAIGVRLEPDDSLHIEAPLGLQDLFAFRVVPNPVLENERTYNQKGRRAKEIWPELTIVPWG